MLLDLIGFAKPTFYSYMTTTHKWFAHLSDIEKRLHRSGHIQYETSSGVVSRQADRYFLPYSFPANIEDDHIPFLQRGVCIIYYLLLFLINIYFVFCCCP